MNHLTTMMKTGRLRFLRTNVRPSRLVAGALLAAALSGCSTMTGKQAEPLSIQRDEPGVILCQSERAAGGIRLVGRLNVGIYPITRVTLEYRIADASDPVPAVNENGRLTLSGPRTDRGQYRKGAEEVSYAIDANAARALQGKVLWYRWVISYDRGGSVRTDATAIHRTSLDEAGLPRAPGNPGPDSSVALPVSARR